MPIEPFASYNLAGLWMAQTEDEQNYSMRLPGTLDDNNIGQSEEPTITRLSRRYDFKGKVWVAKNVPFREKDGKRYFLEIERTREVRVFIDEEEMFPYAPLSLATSAVFEVTGHLSGTHQILVQSTNRYEVFPETVYDSNMASADTQTNWNGLLGYIRIREEEDAFVDRVFLKQKDDGKASLVLEVHRKEQKSAFLRIRSAAFAHDIEEKIELPQTINPVVLEDIELAEDFRPWSKEDPISYPTTITLDESKKKTKLSIRNISFDKDGKILLNDIPQFIQGEMQEAIFPETTYPPMETKMWEKVFKLYLSYGISSVFFRAYCPPEAAFLVADELGLFLFPEISLAEPVNEITDEEVRAYYKTEALRILKEYGHHPSFIGLSFGSSNPYFEKMKKQREEKDFEVVDLSLKKPSTLEEVLAREFLTACKARDDRHLYLLNGQVLSDDMNQKRPTFYLALGKFDVLPDLKEADYYGENLLGYNYEVFRKRVLNYGLLQRYQQAAKSSYEHTMDAYEKQIDSVLISNEKNGYFLLGVQDMPGYGTHTHGFLNASYVEKPLSKINKKRLQSFFAPQKLIVSITQPILSENDDFIADVYLKNDTAYALKDALSYTVQAGDFSFTNELPEAFAEPRKVSLLTHIRIAKEDLKKIQEEAITGTVEVSFHNLKVKKTFTRIVCEVPKCPASVMEVSSLTPAALEWLANGKNVLLSPNTPDKARSNLNLICSEEHAIFQYLPDGCGDIGLFKRIIHQKSVELPHVSQNILMPFFGKNELERSFLLEFRTNGGSVFFSALRLKEKMEYPEARALLKGIYHYMDSFDFAPYGEYRVSDVNRMIDSVEGE